MRKVVLSDNSGRWFEHGSFVLVRSYDGYAPDAEGAVEMEVRDAVTGESLLPA